MATVSYCYQNSCLKLPEFLIIDIGTSVSNSVCALVLEKKIITYKIRFQIGNILLHVFLVLRCFRLKVAN